MKKKYKLNFELVPDGCWGSNLRTILPASSWNFLKRDARERAGGKCMICGKVTDKLEAHERWQYDEKKGIQKLTDIVAICKDCHSVIHIGFTSLKGDIRKAEDHFMKVNNCSYADYREALGEAQIVHQRLNKVSEWKIDLSYLKKYVKDNNN